MSQSPEHDQAVKDALLETVRRMTPAQMAQFVRDLEAVSNYLRQSGESDDCTEFLLEADGRTKAVQPISGIPDAPWQAQRQRWIALVEADEQESPEAENLLDHLQYTVDDHVFGACSRLETVLDAVGGEERPAYWMVAG